MLKLSGWSRLTWGRDRGRRARGSEARMQARETPQPIDRGSSNHRSLWLSVPGLEIRPTAVCFHGRPVSVPARRLPREGALGLGTTLCDTQADVPSAERLRAQLAFKDSMVHVILQFTPSIAFCYVLHRCESRDIRCRESFFSTSGGNARTPSVFGSVRTFLPRLFSLTRAASGVDVVPVSGETTTADVAGQGRRESVRGRSAPHAPRHALTTVRGSCCWAGFDNDPSAGSPTETLLRLLLPLNDKVQWTSRDVAGGGPLTSPRSEHFTGPFNR